MIIQKSPNLWSCLPTAFAMALNVPVDELIRKIGHDGSDIIEDTPCKRGFHIQEIIPIALDYGYSVTAIDKYPKYMIPNDNQIRELSLNNIPELMTKYSGVICGMWMTRSHAAYFFNDNMIYDPNGYSYPLGQRMIDITSFFIVNQIVINYNKL